MIVKIDYECYDKKTFHVKLKHILSFDSEDKRIYLRKKEVGLSWIGNVQNFDDLLELWKLYNKNDL
jgi:hypothetical protein